MPLSDSPIYDAIYKKARAEWLAAQGLVTGINMTTSVVEAAAPIGTVAANLLVDDTFVLTVVSGPGEIVGTELRLTEAAGDEGTSQTIRLNATQATPYISITEDVVIVATGPANTGGGGGTYTPSLVFSDARNGLYFFILDDL